MKWLALHSQLSFVQFDLNLNPIDISGDGGQYTALTQSLIHLPRAGLLMSALPGATPGQLIPVTNQS